MMYDVPCCHTMMTLRLTDWLAAGSEVSTLGKSHLGGIGRFWRAPVKKLHSRGAEEARSNLPWAADPRIQTTNSPKIEVCLVPISPLDEVPFLTQKISLFATRTKIMISPKVANHIAAALFFASLTRQCEAHGYLKSPRSRNYQASLDPIWSGGTAKDPAPENCPHCLNIGGTEARCGKVGEPPWKLN